MTTRSKTEAATIVLKTIHNDIMKANPTSTITPKKMRVLLRQKMSEVHARNASWTFTASQYDQVRSMFDPAYAKKVAKPAKAPRVKKVKAPAPVEA